MENAPASWNEFKNGLDAGDLLLDPAVGTSATSAARRKKLREWIGSYFASTREELLRLGVSENELSALDTLLQNLLELVQSTTTNSDCARILIAIRKVVTPLEVSVWKAMSKRSHAGNLILSSIETRILKTLETLLPSAAVSYEQGIRDMAGSARLSYRGTATEFREAMREVLDHLAPDADVKAQSGFKLEPNQAGPTQKQKMQYILRARELSDASIRTSTDALQAVQDRVGSFARSVYTRASLSTHTQTTLKEVRQLKQYVDAILGELLEIHAL